MRRGISPVIAAVLLVIIAVAAGVLVWTWVSGFVQRNPTEQPALQERIKIDAVYVNTSKIKGSNEYDTNATIYITNLGEVRVNITAVYVLDAASGNVICSNTTNLSVAIDPHSSGAVRVGDDKQCHFEAGKSYIVKVVTERGTEATYVFIAPRT